MIRRILTWGVVGLLSVASTTACGGDDATGGPAGPSGRSLTPDPDGSEPTSATRATTSTTAPATTTTIPPYSFDGSVPPPELVNTGTDYVAIVQSLLGYVSWLKRHNPDPNHLSEVYVKGTALEVSASENLRKLAADNRRFVDVDQRFEAEVVTVDGDLVTLKLIEHLSAERLIDSMGRVVAEQAAGPVIEYIIVMTSSGAGRWRIADATRSTTDTRVQL